MPPDAVYVGRPTIFGNYHPGSRWDDDEWPLGRFPTHRECVVECYRRWLLDDPTFMGWWRGTLWGAAQLKSGDDMRKAVLDRLPRLAGKTLACWCRLDQPCHADVLLELANPLHKDQDHG